MIHAIYYMSVIIIWLEFLIAKAKIIFVNIFDKKGLRVELVVITKNSLPTAVMLPTGLARIYGSQLTQPAPPSQAVCLA
ncbi:hypothetical protein SAMN05216417_101479 [Nitrosospira multiformis]|uniref:Uncharacterized protein n=1 Tax=Nitrosospira multiformis TaxID=1231 RepID=A0A1I7FH47_9PROT|nr:hypothetical protein SAMN05216417_101479 [Nitrosospira multiformis]